MTRLKMTRCDCGIGDGFYHTSRDGLHEYNPKADPSTACAQHQDIRNPSGIIYGHIDCKYAVAAIDSRRHTTFSYDNYGGKQAAFKVAADWIKQQLQQQSVFEI